MKRLRSYGEDLASAGEKELDRTASFSSSSHHRRFYSKGPPENVRRRPSPAVDDDREGSSSRGVSLRNDNSMSNGFDDREGSRVGRKRVEHDLDGFDDREGSRVGRKRGDHDFSDNFEDREGFGVARKRLEQEGDGFERRKGFDRFRDRDVGGAGSSLASPRSGYGVERERERERERDRDRERVQRSESFCISRREFPKGFRSERNWSRREDGGGSSSWRRFDGRSKRDVDEDAKSLPVEKGSGGGGSSSSRGGMDSGGVSSSRESLRSPQQGVKDVKSPTWSRESTKDSKDSGGDPAKDTKKNDSMAAESGGSATGVGSGSEMEEGELQPDSHLVLLAVHQAGSQRMPENAADTDYIDSRQAYKDDGVKLHEVKTSHGAESPVANSVTCDKKLEHKEENVSHEGVVGVRKQVCIAEEENNVNAKGTEKLSSSQNDPMCNTFVCEDNGGGGAAANSRSLRRKQPEQSVFSNFSFDTNAKVEEFNQKSMDQSLTTRPKNNFDLEVVFDEPKKIIAEKTQKESEPCAVLAKDKGKCVVVSSPDEACLGENSLLIERNFIACRDDAMEGSSARGFELFSSSAGVKVECANQAGGSKTETEKLKLEPLDLSLGLPNVSMPIASNSVAAPPSSPPRARSVQSFGTTLRTGSDCFTTSISFSGSQFIHNPSCSLTHNSVDYDFEQSVKSRPLFQGVDWQALSGTDTLPKEISARQKFASNSNGNGNSNVNGNGSVNGNGNLNGNGNGNLNGNGSVNGNGSIYFTQASLGVLNGRAVQQHGVAPGLDRSSSFQRQASGKSRYQDDLRSPAHSGGSHDARSEYGKDKKRLTGEDSVSRLYRSINQRELEQGIAGEREFIERIIYQILSEAIQTMSRKVNEMPERILTYLKDTVCEIILKEDNREKLRALQEVLRRRSDLNLETLLKSHRVQLQILVAVKTGLPDFIQRGDSIPASDLADIYLYLKCRNCRSSLPVDECDCRFCSQKEGFCSSCMCLACSKFDTALNTCGWVGCDVCNHWCHTDCGLLKSYIRNGRSGSGVQGATEMQFYCLACEHPSEMFGFVKDVFKSCATEWKAETLIKELEYVKRIFSASNDTRGKLLHDVAKQLSLRLQTGANAVEVCKQILGFLNESDSKFANVVGSSGREVHVQPQAVEKSRGVLDGVAALGQEAIWSKPSPAKELSRMESIRVTVPVAEGSSAGGASWSSEMLMNINKKPVVDELDSIVKIKQAEAEMFQKRADDARREAEGLQRIAIAKNDKIEEEYANRIAKLRLSEIEERRRQKHEELQMLERSHREYFNMKTRMEIDIKDLLLKMEATRRNLST